VRVVHEACDRARQWVSADVDDELSRFERVLLAAHTAACPSCREFHAATVAITTTLRAEPLEQPTRLVEIRRARRRLRARLAPAVAAMAVVAVGLGSVLASSDIQSGSVGSSLGERQSSSLAGVDAINQSMASALERASAQQPTVALAPEPQQAGGPVLQER
jgi:predicted anti-sigma-YlaC factor YlaD